MTHPFLSDEWIEAAKAIRHKYADQTPPIPTVLRFNQVITDVPFGDGERKLFIDTSSGELISDAGELEDADCTITVDYDTARAMIVDQDQQVVMQAFMGGKVKVQGDMTKLMMMQTMPQNDATQAIAQEIKDITAP